MAAKEEKSSKRKRSGDSQKEGIISKKPSFVKSKSTKTSSDDDGFKKKTFDKSSKGGKKPQYDNKSDYAEQQKEPKTKREARLQAKELAEARKKKRKRHYTLEQELASLWEKMRRRNITKLDRSALVSQALQKMTGTIPEIAGSHVSSRVLQTCVKFCTQAERDAVFEELKPHLLTLACNVYAVHLVKKMLDNASKIQLEGFISSLHGHVASLLRHMVGSAVIEHAFHLANASQKQSLLVELYSTELQLFKDLVSTKESRLVDIIPKLGLQKASVQRHMASVIQPILEKGIVDHSIIHSALLEYFSVADKTSAADVIQQLSGPLLVRMIHTRAGSKLGILCVKHGSAKERKKIIKGMKSHVGKIAYDQCGSLVLACILSMVDDTKLINKIIIRELQTMLKDLALDKSGRRPLLQLLHPNYQRYLGPEDLASLSLSVPSLSKKEEAAEVISELESGKGSDNEMGATSDDPDSSKSLEEDKQLVDGGKKDPSVRRIELLVNSGLAESLTDICVDNAGELLRSNFGKEVLYEVVTGGADQVLLPTLSDKLETLHKAIAALAALPKEEKPEEEHVLINFHSSRTIRKLIFDCPSFASIIWKTAFKGKCEMWSQGHSSKVVCAFLESTNPDVQDLAKPELQPLIDSGILKMPEMKLTKQCE
ncbi:pumilio homolog 24-like [Papaver somniferum]|uniref:pumilio homolog 24-like n=1 Tax=Papaver somniferum TaxID=3469 RepID=UPI000E6FA7AE|nr:pumilio homolog 24-like [Papaver somniferum]